MKSTLGEAKSACSESAGFCESDPRLVGRINLVQQRLLHMGKWVGTYQHYRFCATSGCITLPRQLQTLEVVAQCGYTGTIRPEWFEYVRDGFGLSGACTNHYQDKGEGHVAFDDVVGLNKVLRVYSDKTETGSPTILLNFWDNNRLSVRTEYPVAGTWIDGERVVISTTQTNTVNQCMAGGLVGVQKPRTKGHVFLYEYDTVTLAQRLLAVYEPDETIPNYRRYVIPFAAQSGSNCERQIVDVIAKRRYIPAVNDDDELLIGNLGALDLGCRALRYERADNPSMAFTYWSGARAILDDELNQFMGDGAQGVIQVMDEFQNAAVETIW